jgi:crotonobetainyl-CoA:carnitine CoA-transferase CaiB-like acyl-CoA transferase
MIEAGVPAGQVLSIPQILAHPHIGERGFIRRFDTPSGTQQVTSAGFHMSGGIPTPATPAPALSADTETWLRHTGYSDEQIDAFRKEGVI